MIVPYWIKTLLLPPADLLLLAAVGGLLTLRWKRAGRWIVAVSIVLLAVLSMPACSLVLLGTLQAHPALVPADLPDDAGAIVVLSADFDPWAPEYGGPSVGAMTLSRLRYGAWLHRATGLPLLVSGGALREDWPAVGLVMAATLRDELGVPARWVETGSRNTFGNAQGSAAILRPAGVDKVFLVTSSFHMPRAVAAFEAVGLEVVPAPTGVHQQDRLELGDFVPSAPGLLGSYLACHEWIGRLWYALTYP